MDDLSPEGINLAHGKPTWRCWGCKAETGLHWYHGWSVAMCDKPECAKGYNAMCREQEEAQDYFDARYREIYGDPK
jgi:hypothetical protein